MNDESNGHSSAFDFFLLMGIIGVIGFVLTCVLAVPE